MLKIKRDELKIFPRGKRLALHYSLRLEISVVKESLVLDRGKTID